MREHKYLVIFELGWEEERRSSSIKHQQTTTAEFYKNNTSKLKSESKRWKLCKRSHLCPGASSRPASVVDSEYRSYVNLDLRLKASGS